MRGGQNERTYGPATSFGKIVSEDQDDSWDRSVQGMVEPRGVVSKSGIAKGWKPALGSRCSVRRRNAEDAEAVVRRRWRPGLY